jgi:hypothetical protein
MADDTHDMGLMAVCVDGVAQRLAVVGGCENARLFGEQPS